MAHDDLARKKTGQQGNRGAYDNKREIARGAKRERAEHRRDLVSSRRVRPPEGQNRREREESNRRKTADHRAAKAQATKMALELLSDERVGRTHEVEDLDDLPIARHRATSGAPAAMRACG